MDVVQAAIEELKLMPSGSLAKARMAKRWFKDEKGRDVHTCDNADCREVFLCVKRPARTPQKPPVGEGVLNDDPAPVCVCEDGIFTLPEEERVDEDENQVELLLFCCVECREDVEGAVSGTDNDDEDNYYHGRE